MKSIISTTLAVLMLSNMVFADAIQDKFQSVLNSKINGQTASFSKDDRIRVLLGCERYTYTLSATLSNPVVLKTEGSLEDGFTVQAKANYNGLHVADRWEVPCVQKGTDKKSLSGTVTFTITRPSAFAQANLAINQVSNDSLKYTGHVVETAVRRTFSF
jgi:hypothetical protein